MARWVRRVVNVVAVAALLSGCAKPQVKNPLGPRDYSTIPDTTFYKIDLASVVRNPSQNMAVSFRAIMDTRDEKIWQPMLTPFTPEDYTSFSAWPPEARLWEEEGRRSSVPTLFMRKDAPHYDQLSSSQRYNLVEVKGVIKSVFGDPPRPWVEVYYLNPLSDGPVYTDESIARLLYGLEDADKLVAPAIKNLDMALMGRLYTPARSLAHTTLGGLYEKRAASNPPDWRKAWEHYDAAVKLDPGNKVAREGFDRASIHVEQMRLQAKTNEPAKAPEAPKPPEK